MKERRATLEAEGQKVFGIDLGDLIDRVHPLVEAEDGKIASSSSNVYKAVADGEMAVGLTYEDPA